MINNSTLKELQLIKKREDDRKLKALNAAKRCRERSSRQSQAITEALARFEPDGMVIQNGSTHRHSDARGSQGIPAQQSQDEFQDLSPSSPTTSSTGLSFFSATLHVENSAPVIQHPEHQEEEDDEESIQQEPPERRARQQPQSHHQAGTSVSAQMDQIGNQQRMLDQRQRRQRTIYSPQI